MSYRESVAIGLPKLFSDDVANTSSSSKNADYEEKTTKLQLPRLEDVKEFFELDRCATWIRENAYKKVALQFPDGYLKFAFDIARFLENAIAKMYILGDTSYGSCCVDYISAEHANCDALIHFGDTCMSGTVPLPILYIFGRYQFDCVSFETELRQYVYAAGDNIAVLFDSEFDCQATVRGVFNNAEVFQLVSTENDSSFVDDVVLRRHVPKHVRKWIGATLVFVGSSCSALLPIWLMTFSTQFSVVLHYTPNNGIIELSRPSTSRMLRKRLYLMEKLRDANSIGLVIGTLAVHGFREAVMRTRELCRAANKRLYVFSIGKINEAKLSNFADHVDAFILLSCPFGIILNTGDYYKPIVSFYEAEVALNPDKDWFSSAGWTSEFSGFINDSIGKTKEETLDVSLITGRIRAIKPISVESNELTNRDRMQVVQYSADEYFANRSWKGLNDEISTNVGDIRIKRGLEGIAVDYGEAE